MSGEVRVLGAGDEALLFSFLEKHLESSVLIVSNAERGGLVNRGEPFQATYAANVVNGELTAVAAHGWHGNVLLQGDAGIEAAALLAKETTGRTIRGIIGPLGLVRRSRSKLAPDSATVACDLDDRLFVLELERLRVPALLEDPAISFRSPTESEVVDMLAGWRVAYEKEIFGAERTPELEAEALQTMNAYRLGENGWVLTRHGVPVAFTAINARTRGIVHIGGVFTPPEFRRNGYARAAVAASLLLARQSGATKSTLFTGVANIGAIRAYTTLGYEARGEFGLLFFR